MWRKVRILFVGNRGLRSGWRLLLFVLGGWGLAQILFWLLTGVYGYKFQEGWTLHDLTVECALDVLVIVAATLVTSKLERKSPAEYGLDPRRAFGSQFWIGMLWGFLGSTGVLLIIWAAGGASIQGFALHGADLVRSALYWLPGWILLGFCEEAFYRGYPLSVLCRSLGFWPTSILYSALFGGLHYFLKPNESWMDGVSVALFGLFWCFTLRRTGSLWFAIGFHGMSDYSDMVIYAAPNTGNGGQSLSGHLVNVIYQGPAWLTGGACGMEASVVSLFALAVMFLLFHRLYPTTQFPIQSQSEGRTPNPANM